MSKWPFPPVPWRAYQSPISTTGEIRDADGNVVCAEIPTIGLARLLCAAPRMLDALQKVASMPEAEASWNDDVHTAIDRALDISKGRQS